MNPSLLEDGGILFETLRNRQVFASLPSRNGGRICLGHESLRIFYSLTDPTSTRM